MNALWGFLGVLVGAAVTLVTTWWQLNRDRETRLNASEAAALRDLQEELGQWFARTVHGIAGVFDEEDARGRTDAEGLLEGLPVAMDVKLIWLKERCRDERLRHSIRDFMTDTVSACQTILNSDISSREDCERAMIPIARAHTNLQGLLGERLRLLEA